ncbi:hypothetical protein [Corynebacterium anserum]|nr:hypothetical protein [Corynebacterium anserum]
MVQAAWNANVRIDITDADRDKNYFDVDSWLEQRGLVEFKQGERIVRMTHKHLLINMKEKYGLSDEGRFYMQTVATTIARGFAGASSTLMAVGGTKYSTLRVKLTF